MLVWTLFLFSLNFQLSHEKVSAPFAHLPVIPLKLPELASASNYTKHIPRKLWIAVKDRNDPLPGHLKDLFDRNPTWEVNICDNKCKDHFMQKEFGNTSVSAIYNIINPLVGAARADVWRYAVLYTYGGVYLDDDSDMKTPLDEIISEDDRLIMSEEGSSSLGDCYIPTFHLSDQFTFDTYFAQNKTTTATHFNFIKDSKIPVFFHDHTLVNWGMFAAPRHPLFQHTLTNIVEIVNTEYTRQSVVHMTRWDAKWKQVMCSTGFVLTYTLREIELQALLPSHEEPRIVSNNFKQYKGNVKAFWTGGDSSHYMKAMQRKNGPHLLREFAPVNMDRILQFLNNRAVMGDNGKTIYLIRNNKKYTFGSYDTFLNMGFTDRSTRHVNDHILEQISDGGDVSKSRSKEEITITSNKESVAVISPISSSSLEMSSFLYQVITAINQANQTECWSDDYDGTRDDFLQNKHSDLIQNTPVLVHPLCTNTYQLGNTFGYYFNDIACADLAGAHFIAVTKKFKIILPHTLVTYGNITKQFSFFSHLPDLIVHANPKPLQEAQAIAKKQCHCLQYCWENSEAPWLQRTSLVRSVLSPAVDAYVRESSAESLGTKLSNETDRLYLPPKLQKRHHVSYNDNANYKLTPVLSALWLPLQPNVTLQYRCGDNIGFGKTKYGLLPFSAFKRISNDSEYIYIIADSPQRNGAHVYSYRCETILDRLVAYLVKRYADSVIVLKRGGDIFLDYARIMNSQAVFCSASTFCLWPALGNDVGQVYFPLTPLIARAESNTTAPKLKNNFHWIDEVSMIKQFKHYRPWTALIDELETL